MTYFLSLQEKVQLQNILSRSSQLLTPYERINFLTFCGLERYSGLVEIQKP